MVCFDAYPNGKILSNKTGFTHAEKWYGSNQYIGYDSLGRNGSRFFQDKIDERLPAMERVVDITSQGKFKIYPYSKISESGVINDEFNSKKIVLFHQYGQVSILGEKKIAEAHDIGTVTVFKPIIDGQLLTFKKVNGIFVDEQTNSNWTIAGKCIKGELKGSELDGELYGNHFAFAWFAFYPDSEIYSK